MNFERWLGLGLAAMVVTACAAKTTTGSSANDLQQAAKGDAGAASCLPEACGPKPLGAEVLCSDGSTAGVTGRCLAAADGSCGWEITECAGAADAGPATCLPEACGPKPLGVEVLCSDGSTAGVTNRCLAAANGSCGWEITECPAATDAGETDPCLGENLPACPKECSAFPMKGTCVSGDQCRQQGSKIGDECKCDASGTWSCSPHPPLGMGCNRVCT